MKKLFEKVFYGWFGRFLRVFVAQLGVAFGISNFDWSQFSQWIQEPKIVAGMLISAFIVAASKFVRDQWGIDIKLV